MGNCCGSEASLNEDEKLDAFAKTEKKPLNEYSETDDNDESVIIPQDSINDEPQKIENKSPNNDEQAVNNEEQTYDNNNIDNDDNKDENNNDNNITKNDENMTNDDNKMNDDNTKTDENNDDNDDKKEENENENEIESDSDNDNEREASIEEEDDPEQIMNEFKKYLNEKDFTNCMNIFGQNPKLQSEFLNIKLENGDNTLLHACSYDEQLKFVTVLLQAEANVNVQNSETGFTPLMYGAKNENIGLITLLLKNESLNREIKNKDDKTASDIANELNNEAILQLINPDFLKIIKQEKEQKKISENETDFMKEINANADNNNDDNNNNNEKEDSLSIKTDEDEKENDDKLGQLPQNTNTETLKNEGQNKRISLKSKLRQQSKRALDTISTLDKEKSLLPELADFLQLKDRGKYKKYFVFVKDGHLMWHSTKVKINNNKKLTREQRSVFKGCINLLVVNNVEPYKSKKKNKFKFLVTTPGKTGKKNKDIEYLFLCDSLQQRYKWSNGVKQHWEYANKSNDSIASL